MVAELTLTLDNGQRQTFLFDPSYGKKYTLPRSPAVGDRMRPMDDPAIISFYGIFLGRTPGGNLKFLIRKNEGGDLVLLGTLPR